MNGHISISRFTNPSGEQVWRVHGRMADGQRVRQNFKEREDAVARRAELEIQALNRPCGAAFKQTRLTNEQLAEAEAAFMKLGGQPLLPAVEYFLKHGRSTAVDITIQGAVQKFLAVKATQKKRKRTLQDYRSRLGPLVEFYGDRAIRLISRADLETLIFKPEQAADTANGNRRVLHALFAWCAEQDYVAVNPVSKIATTARDDKEPEILTVAEVKLLLHAAMNYKDGKLLPYAVLGLFMGLRPEEIARLNWKHVDLDQRLIRIQGDVAKLRQRRVIAMPINAVEWLKVCHGKLIVPPNMRRGWNAVRRLAGFKGSRHQAGDGNLKPWPQDVIRHTGISFHYAFGKDEDATAYWAGNSPSTIHGFYKGLVNPKDAQDFMNMTPTNLNAKIVILPMAA